MSLTDTAIRKAKPAAKTKRLYDTKGLYLEVSPRGGKWWRLKYRYAGKEKRLSLGTYPDVSLKEARDRRDDARKLLRNSVDPGVHRKQTKAARVQRHANTFEAVAREWHAKRTASISASYTERTLSRLVRFVFPYLGTRPLAEIEPPEILAVLRKIESRGTGETAHRVRQVIGQVFRYGVATGRAQRDPTADLRGALAAVKGNNFPAVTEPIRVGELLRAFDAHSGEPVVAAALQLAPYLFVRPGELRTMRWEDVDTDSAEWRFNASKTGIERLVPLAPQPLAIIESLRPLTGQSEYVFRSLRGNRPISDAALTAALRRLGIPRSEHTIHGWRATARTLLHERLNWRPEVIEHQLGHKVPDTLGSAYNRTRFLEERRLMMCAWADYLDALKNGDNVVGLRSRRA